MLWEVTDICDDPASIRNSNWPGGAGRIVQLTNLNGLNTWAYEYRKWALLPSYEEAKDLERQVEEIRNALKCKPSQDPIKRLRDLLEEIENKRKINAILEKKLKDETV